MVSADRWLTLGLVLLPIIYKRAKPAYKRWRGDKTALPTPNTSLAMEVPPAADPRPSPYLPYLRYSVIVALLVFCVVQGVVNRPINIFSALDLPLSTPSTVLESTSREAYGSEYVQENGQLLVALRSAEARTNYMKVGSAPLVNCGMLCPSRTLLEYSLYSLPARVKEYMIMAAGLGIVSAEEKRISWRIWLVAPLAMTAIAEAGILMQDWTKATPIHDNLHLLRYGVCFLLTLISAFLPAQAKVQSLPTRLAPTLTSLLQRQEVHMSRLHALAIQRRAVSRNTTLKAHQAKFDQELEQDAEMVMKDKQMVELMSKEKETSKAVENWVEGLFLPPKTGLKAT